MDFKEIIAKLDALSENCRMLYDCGEMVGWHAEIQKEWELSCMEYQATKNAVELLGYKVYHIAGDNGMLKHVIEKEVSNG